MEKRVTDNEAKRSAVESTLTDKLGAFYGFVGKRVNDPQLAKDLVHDALLKAVERADVLNQETVVAWFYRVLRNSIVDRYRSEQARNRVLERLASEFAENPNAEIERDLCECMAGLLEGLKPSYAEVLRHVDLGGKRLREYAKEKGRSENAMRVKLHRAREQLKSELKWNCKACAEHGCIDCDCK